MRQFILLLLVLVVFSCENAPESQWSELDLTRYNIPMTIMAPDSAKVASSTLSGIMQDVTVKSLEDNFSIQILASRASTNDMARLKADQLELVRANRYFEQVVSEEADGFIFQNQIDSTSHYGFRYIVYQGDQEFVFQNAFGVLFGEEAIRAMYEAVQQD
ncbi:hypothetical protein [Lewinella sp. W8]|uniref:hypothetical protein n=1 Tax=Lewinella sp. W8 TaxID=2528208 RepID=UPI001067D093|nr:hypothetical protein [Lewinella sp. W8]MTB51097.1 hypothetical protein [Lewinella sp. W8]